MRHITPEHVLPAVEKDLEDLKTNFKELESVFANPQKSDSWGKRRIEYDYSGVVESMERVGRPLDYSWGVVGHMMGVKNSEALREAHNKMQGEVIKTRLVLSSLSRGSLSFVTKKSDRLRSTWLGYLLQ